MEYQSSCTNLSKIYSGKNKSKSNFSVYGLTGIITKTNNSVYHKVYHFVTHVFFVSQ